MTHTEGPWFADYHYAGPKHLPTLIKVNPNTPGMPFEECLATARLIAAAPELLRALDLLIGDVEQHCMSDDPDVKQSLDIARAAYAKATN